MGPNIGFLTSIIGCILLMKESKAEGKLSKPELEVLTSDPNDVIMIGDKVEFNCTNWTNAQIFFLIKDNITIADQVSSTFIVNEMSKNDSGLYRCHYRLNKDQSELSDAIYVYVKETYPAPTLTAKPSRNPQPRQSLKITCEAPYPNIIFTIYKNGHVLGESADNPFSYVLERAGKKDNGQYMCHFRTKHNSLMSDFSDPVMLSIQELPMPSVSWEVNADDEDIVKITCNAPVKFKNMWFWLLNSSKDIEDEKSYTDQNTVSFNISIPKLTQKKYYCIYSTKMYNNFAHSAISSPTVIWGDGDYTTMNIMRLLFSALVLIVLSVILVKHFNMFLETQENPPALPAYIKTHAVESEYSEMVIMSTEQLPEDVLDEPPSSCQVSSDIGETKEEE